MIVPDSVPNEPDEATESILIRATKRSKPVPLLYVQLHTIETTVAKEFCFICDPPPNAFIPQVEREVPIRIVKSPIHYSYNDRRTKVVYPSG
jgi:hypothetical protein